MVMAKNKINELTPAELEVMQVIWSKESAFLGEIADSFAAEKRPAYTTISTVVRTLERKGFVSHKSCGNSYNYFANISKEEYRRGFLNNALKTLFDNSPGQLMSFFTEKDSLTVEQYEELREIAKRITEK